LGHGIAVPFAEDRATVEGGAQLCGEGCERSRCVNTQPLPPGLATPQVELESCDVSSIVADVLNEIEADSYWCFCALVEVIQDFFTPDRTGLQSQIQALHDLMGKYRAARFVAPPPGRLGVRPCSFQGEPFLRMRHYLSDR